MYTGAASTTPILKDRCIFLLYTITISMKSKDPLFINNMKIITRVIINLNYQIIFPLRRDTILFIFQCLKLIKN
jgi:hypothetical protein